MAELVDNAVDPDVAATQFCIDVQEIDGQACLVLMDNGYGMSPLTLHKMLGFGHSEKKQVNGHQPIGFYGNGFKSGSMRLGKDVLVMTKCPNSGTMSVGFLSQTFLEEIQASEIIVPMLTWDLDGNRIVHEPDEWDENMEAITKYSMYTSETAILSQLNVLSTMQGHAGTIITISNLRTEDGKKELDFETDPTDIRIAPDEFGSSTPNAYQQSRPMQASGTEVPIDYSLRAYLQVLYRVPRMQIFLRGEKVKSKRIGGILQDKITDHYRPRDFDLPCTIEMGMNTENSNLYGVMIYHKNRLIQAYKRIGLQLEANDKGIGVLSVVEANHLQPTHNKQDFDDTRAYRHLMLKLSSMLKEYWTVKMENQQETTKKTSQKKKPDILWVQCDYPYCLKWRILPDDYDVSLLKDAWYCNYHPDPAFQDHSAPEQVPDYDGTTERKRLKKAFLDQQKESKKRKTEEQERMKKLFEEQLRKEQEALKMQAEAAVQEKAAVISEQLAKFQEEKVARMENMAAEGNGEGRTGAATDVGCSPAEPSTPALTPIAGDEQDEHLTLQTQKEVGQETEADRQPGTFQPHCDPPSWNLKQDSMPRSVSQTPGLLEKESGQQSLTPAQSTGSLLLPAADRATSGPSQDALLRLSGQCLPGAPKASGVNTAGSNRNGLPVKENGTPRHHLQTGINLEQHKSLMLEKMKSIDAEFLKQRAAFEPVSTTQNGLTDLEIKLTRNIRAALGIFHLMGLFPFSEEFIRKMGPSPLGEFKLEDLLLGND
uniref:CW-type domain-containing protein n=1 Tax=Picocystis salinarum TaxID=88271 RepID=A0A7S3UB35_9CHLO